MRLMKRRMAFLLVTTALLLASCDKPTVSSATSSTVPATVAQDVELTVASYNMLFGKRGIGELARQLKTLDADIVLLQECGQGQAQELAAAAGYPTDEKHIAYAQNNGILSRYPLSQVQSIEIPRAARVDAIWATAEASGRRFAVASVHLVPTNILRFDLEANRNADKWRTDQINRLLEHWESAGRPPLILGGDFNQFPDTGNYRLVANRLTDVHLQLKKAGPTYGVGWANARIDYIFVSDPWKPRDAGIGTSNASDHRPVWARLRLPGH